MNSYIVLKDDLVKNFSVNEFIDSSINGTVFASEWFSSIKDVKEYLICKVEEKIVSIMPLFCELNSKVLNQSTMYIPYGGPVVLNVPKEERNKTKFLRELNNSIIKTLKQRYDEISFSIDPYMTDIMPYIRQGFMPEVRYTYILDITNPDSLYQNYGHDRRKEIRKANSQRLQFVVDNNLTFTDIAKFVDWESKYGFESSVEEVKQILTNAILNDNGMCFVALKNKTVLGSVGVLWRNKTAYIMYSYFDKNFDCGTIAFLYDNIFKYLNKNKNVSIIDFEGSVYESVENWNISFGAFQKTFFNLHYNKNGNDEIARSMYEYFEK